MPENDLYFHAGDMMKSADFNMCAMLNWSYKLGPFLCADVVVMRVCCQRHWTRFGQRCCGTALIVRKPTLSNRLSTFRNMVAGREILVVWEPTLLNRVNHVANTNATSVQCLCTMSALADGALATWIDGAPRYVNRCYWDRHAVGIYTLLPDRPSFIHSWNI